MGSKKLLIDLIDEDVFTWNILTFSDVEMWEAGAVKESHGEAGVVQGPALRHVQEAQHGGGGGGGPGAGHRDGGDHRTAWHHQRLRGARVKNI